MDTLQLLLVSVFTILATQGVKRAKNIPINKGQAIKLRTLSAVLAFGSSLVIAFANGTLETFLSPELIDVGINGGISWLLAHLGYQGAKPLGFFKK